MRSLSQPIRFRPSGWVVTIWPQTVAGMPAACAAKARPASIPSLLVNSSKKTTFPPIVPPAAISTNTSWTQQAIRDNFIGSSTNPDLGYHYDPLDYLINGSTFNGLSITNGVSLTLQAGVAVGMMEW